MIELYRIILALYIRAKTSRIYMAEGNFNFNLK